MLRKAHIAQVEANPEYAHDKKLYENEYDEFREDLRGSQKPGLKAIVKNWKCLPERKLLEFTPPGLLRYSAEA
jgi:hypothetical protein